MRSFRFIYAALLIGLCNTVIADLTTNYNPTGEGCVDTKGFLSCYQTQIDKAVACNKACNTTIPDYNSNVYQNCVLGCTGSWLAGNIGCWIQSCWNQVYSCEYQLTAISYFGGLDIVMNRNVPFFPPPDTASTGACTCNLGYVYGNKTAIADYGVCINIASSSSKAALETCDCCAFAWAPSNIINTCPKNDLTILGFPNFLAKSQDLVGKSTDNCAIIDTNAQSCAADYGFPWAGPKAYNPLNLPTDQPGTLPLSNNAGNAFTVFQPSLFTMTLFPAFTSTISAAPFVTTAGANLETLVSTGVLTGIGGTTATGSGTKSTGTTTGNGVAPAATTTKASSSVVVKSSSVFSGMLILAVIAYNL